MDLDKFFRAVREGDVQTVRRGLEAGVDVNAKRDDWLGLDQTSLHWASEYGQTEVAEFLIKNGADLEARDILDRTSLHVASVNGQTEVAELLIKHGADLEARDEDQDTPLHKAAAGGHTGTCELLIRPGADVMAKDKHQATPLHKAAADGHTKTCELLIRSGADVMVQNKYQDTPLHHAAAGGYTGTCELLIRSGADVMIQNKFQSTPLHKAAAKAWLHTGTCELLIRAGADVTAKDKEGKSPLNYTRDSKSRLHLKNLDRQLKQERSYHELMQQSGGVKVNRFKVFIGGKEETGKSTLKESLTKGLLSALIQRLSRRPVSQPHDPTPGVDIGTFHVPGVGEVSVWDFAGQAEYAVTHNMFMDAENTVFIVLYNITDSENIQEKQVHWWLCFIKSCNPDRQPDVILVASHADQVAEIAGQRRAAHILHIMKARFKEHLRISDEVILMDCRRTRTPEMERLKTALVRIRKVLLQHQQDMPKLCAKIMESIPKWSRTSPKCPVMKWPEYLAEVRKLDKLLTEDFLEKSTWFLHHLGELLFIGSGTCNPIIVLRPSWLGTDVFGRVMAPDNFNIPHLERTSRGVTKDEIKHVFQDVADVDLMITLLQEFQLCHTYDKQTYIIPGLLTETMPDEVWKPTTEQKVVYFGKQVQCADSTDMFSSGFFPRVQTRLMRELENHPSLWRDGAKCVDRNLESLIKLSPDGRAVNICVRSVQGNKVQCGKMLQQLENIIADVLDECSPGTGTVENVLSARALKEHREEFYSYGKEEISKAAVKDGTIVHPVLQFTEQINDLLCSEDGDPDTEDTKVSQPSPCKVDPREQDIMPSQLTDELQDKERPTTRTFPKPVQALAQQNTEDTKVFHAVQSGVDSTEEDMAMPAQMTGEHQNKKEPLNKNSPQRILQDTVETKVFKAVQDEADPLSADMLMATLSINQPQDKLMPTQQTDELQQGEDTITDQLNRNRPELVKALIYKVEQILDHLLSRNILSVEECAIIKANRVRQEKARTLLEIVVTKGEGACGVFLDVLKEVCPHAAEIVQGGSSNLPCSEDDDPIKKNRPELVLALRDVEPVMDRLLACDILSGEECNRIRAKETPEDKARELLDIIETKDKGARDMFKEVLEEINPELLM